MTCDDCGRTSGHAPSCPALIAERTRKTLPGLMQEVASVCAVEPQEIDDAITTLVTAEISEAMLAQARMRVKRWIGKSQYRVMRDNCNGEEGDFFKRMFVELAERLRTMPFTYQQDGKGDDAVVYLHYFSASSDWYIIEKDKGDEDDTPEQWQSQAFGYAVLNGDEQCAETGYISIPELLVSPVYAELDLYWTSKTLREVKEERERRCRN
jgi:hypothetical protein